GCPRASRACSAGAGPSCRAGRSECAPSVSLSLNPLENPDERARGERAGVPEAMLAEPALRLVGVRGLHHRERLAVVEDAAERELAGAAHLDERDLRHVEV